MPAITQNIVDLIGQYVDKLRRAGAISGITDLNNGTYQIDSSGLDSVEINEFLDINGLKVQINSIDEQAGNMVVTAKSLPAGATWRSCAPYYYHGTPMRVNQEIQNQDSHTTKAQYPAVVLWEVFRQDFDDDKTSIIDNTAKLRMSFLDTNNRVDWSTAEHYDNVIDKMEDYSNAFIEILRKAPEIARFLDYSYIKRVNFGKFVRDRGHTEYILDDNLSGLDLEMDLPIRKGIYCKNDNSSSLKGTPCAPSIILNSDGSLNQYLGAGEDFTIPDPVVCDPVSVDDQGVIINVNAGGSYVCTPVTVQAGIEYAVPTKPTQITSYRTGDTGYNLQNGLYDYTPPAFPLYRQQLDYSAASPSTTLLFDNAFGSKERFTDENGLQVYANSYYIDHLTGRGYSYADLGVNGTWTECVDAAFNFADALFADYRILNFYEMDSLCDYENITEPLDHTPSSGIFWNTMWLGDTNVLATTNKQRYSRNGRGSTGTGFTASASRFYVRNHYY